MRPKNLNSLGKALAADEALEMEVICVRCYGELLKASKHLVLVACYRPY